MRIVVAILGGGVILSPLFTVTHVWRTWVALACALLGGFFFTSHFPERYFFDYYKRKGSKGG